MSDKVQVLLIEDNPQDARTIREALSDVKMTGPTAPEFDLAWTDHLSDGLRHLSTRDADVILLDLSLPDSQGLDALFKVSARAPDVPIVVLTALDDEERALQAVREGAQDYLVKEQITQG
jgi:DNA-binding response OmpR family regulator